MAGLNLGRVEHMDPLDFSMKYKVSMPLVDRVMGILADEPYRFIAVSGKLGAGKDTIAPMLTRHFGIDSVHEFFAEPLKTEINMVILIISLSHSVMEARSTVALRMQVADMRQSNRVVRALYDDVKNGVVKSAYDRTPSTRDALQLWGTEVRRAQEPDYWVVKAMQSSVNVLASGKSVYVTDVRFVNEMDAVKALGGYGIRLNVSEEEQSRRIMKRDGTVVTDAMRNHISETQLDDYHGFDAVVNTDGRNPDDITTEIINQLNSKEE